MLFIIAGVALWLATLLSAVALCRAAARQATPDYSRAKPRREASGPCDSDGRVAVGLRDGESRLQPRVCDQPHSPLVHTADSSRRRGRAPSLVSGAMRGLRRCAAGTARSSYVWRSGGRSGPGSALEPPE